MALQKGTPCCVIEWQSNGGWGVDFSDPNLTEDQVLKVADKLGENGVQLMYVTVVTTAWKAYPKILATIVRAMRRQKSGARIVGVFLA